MKLKPCPFCGNTKVFGYYDKAGFVVACRKYKGTCGIQVRPEPDLGDDSNRVAHVWNRRASGFFVLKAAAGYVAFTPSRGDYFAPELNSEVVRFSSQLEALGASVLLNNGAAVEPV